MNEVYIAPQDLQKSLNDMTKYSTKVQELLKEEVLRAAYAIVNKAKENCRHVTGNLVGKISVKEDNMDKLQARAYPPDHSCFLLLKVKEKNTLKELKRY